MINVTNELSDAHKKSLKEDIMDEITEKLMEKLQDVVNQKVQDALKKYQDTTNKKLKKTQKQLNELRDDFNKNTKVKQKRREIYEIREDNTRYERGIEKYVENLRKKESNRNPGNKKYLSLEGHSTRLEQWKTRKSLRLEDKTDIKEKKKKTEELLVKQLKSFERNVKEHSNSIKRSNLRLMGTEEEEVQAK
jgi:hypothetical protein